MDLVLVDGPNVFNTVGRRLSKLPCVERESDLLRDYLLNWFDMDRLVNVTLGFLPLTGPQLGTVVFRSRRQLGRDNYRLDQKQTEEFWGRQATLPYVSEVLIEVPGKQSDQYKCTSCGHSVSAEAREKGVDASMICYLFETLEAWNSVCLFTDDADFVPPVQALRRKGKAVFCSFNSDFRDSGFGVRRHRVEGHSHGKSQCSRRKALI